MDDDYGKSPLEKYNEVLKNMEKWGWAEIPVGINPDDITCRCKSCEQGKKVYEPENKPRTGRLIEAGE